VTSEKTSFHWGKDLFEVKTVDAFSYRLVINLKKVYYNILKKRIEVMMTLFPYPIGQHWQRCLRLKHSRHYPLWFYNINASICGTKMLCTCGNTAENKLRKIG